MTSCCSSAFPPQVRFLGGCPDVSETSIETKLFDTPPYSAPLSPFKDIRSQLTDLRHRQEELFRQLIDQQKAIQSQLSVMHSDSKASTDVQAFLKQRQEYLITEVQKFSSSRGRMVNMAKTVLSKDVQAKDTEKIITASGMELVGDVCLPIEPARAKPACAADLCIDTNLESPSSANWQAQQSFCSQVSGGGSPSRKNSRRRNSMMKISARAGHHEEEEEIDRSFKARLDRMLISKEFEFVVAGAIMINAFIMCWECQYQGLDVGFQLQYPGRPVEAQTVWSGAETAFNFFDLLFGSLFVLEMVVKLLCWRCRYFYDSDGWEFASEDLEVKGWKLVMLQFFWSVRGWNILDFSCVLTFLFDKGLTVVSVNPQMLRLLRLFRLFRLVRLLRFLETLDHLYIMTTAIAGLSKVLSWAIVLLTTMLLICDLFLVQILHATYFNKVTAAALSEEQLEKHHRMYEYFGTFTRCMLSMFEITLGNWPPVARLLSEEVSEWFILLCLVHKLTIGFAVIGVITGVILQETFKVAQTDDLIMFRQKKLASRTLRQKMKILFDALDQEGDGRLEESEFEAIGDFPEIKCWLASLDIETDDLKTLFALIDVHGRGYVTLDELVARMPRIQGNAKGIDMLALRNLFQL